VTGCRSGRLHPGPLEGLADDVAIAGAATIAMATLTTTAMEHRFRILDSLGGSESDALTLRREREEPPPASTHRFAPDDPHAGKAYKRCPKALKPASPADHEQQDHEQAVDTKKNEDQCGRRHVETPSLWRGLSSATSALRRHGLSLERQKNFL
jgi:hypothetical protein